ncbi:MAG: hypothetical protein AWM53_01009 [Candidatus Dichloromethanomonas elyunquensis]|nr:MAG: hypothetical protein AWM53_01009 [Candidatus Dichloromethanomonas elyunquensis]
MKELSMEKRLKAKYILTMLLSAMILLISLGASPSKHVSEGSISFPVSQYHISEEVKHALHQESSLKHADLLRKFPYPYDAMLAICSDADMTTLQEFEEYHRFLNTKEKTLNGIGLGLDIGDSAWMYIANDTRVKADKDGNSADFSMSYFQGVNSNTLKDADKIVHYFKAGWIDSLHTFGDFSRNDHTVLFRRDLAVSAWKAMNESGFKPKVWINHGSESNVQNFGGYNSKRITKYQGGMTLNPLIIIPI